MEGEDFRAPEVGRAKGIAHAEAQRGEGNPVVLWEQRARWQAWRGGRREGGMGGRDGEGGLGHTVKTPAGLIQILCKRATYLILTLVVCAIMPGC